MTDISMTLAAMHRPGVLVRAARFAASAMARRAAPPAGARALDRLLSEEEMLNTARTTGEAGYSPTRHITVLAELLAAASPQTGAVR